MNDVTRDFYNTRSGRIVLLDRRMLRLQEIFHQQHPGLRVDWQSFPDENLWDRYRIRDQKARRIQRLYRRCERETTELIDQILEQS